MDLSSASMKLKTRSSAAPACTQHVRHNHFRLQYATTFWLVLLVLLSDLFRIEASLLDTPELHWSLQPPNNFGNDEIAENNGVAIDSVGEFAYATTLEAKLLRAALKDATGSSSRSTVFFEAPALQANVGTLCQTGVALYKDEFAIFAVVDQNVFTNVRNSRIFVVPLANVPTSNVVTFSVEGTVKGTPLVNEEGHVIVVHDSVAGNGAVTGHVSFFNIAQEQLITSLDRSNTLALAPPARVRISVPSGGFVSNEIGMDWIVFGNRDNDGESNNGDLFAVRYNPSSGTALWHTVSQGIGSMKKAPALSPDGMTIVVGGNRLFARAWGTDGQGRNAIRDIIESDQEVNTNERADWEVRVSRQNAAITTQPVLLGTNEHVLMADLQADVAFLNLKDNGKEDWRLDTFVTHYAPPVAFFDDQTNRYVVYDISAVGILRQVEWNAQSNQGNVNYLANCQGHVDTNVVGNVFQATVDDCGALGLYADPALSREGNYIVYATIDGIMNALQVADFGTLAPSPQPSLPPTKGPSKGPTAPPTFGPTPMPTTRGPTRPPSQAPTLAPIKEGTTRAPVTPTPTRPPATLQPVSRRPTPRPTVPPTRNSSGGGNRGVTTPTVSPISGTTGDPTSDGQNTAGIGTDGSGGDGGSSLGGLAIVLGVVAALLGCIVVGALFVLRKRRKDDRELQESAQEAASRRQVWMSHKKQYEEEMRLEEEETMNDLMRDAQPDTPEAIAAARVLSSRKPRKHRRQRSGRGASVGTLGSISESENEDNQELDAFEDDEEMTQDEVGDEESGFELALETIDQGPTPVKANTTAAAVAAAVAAAPILSAASNTRSNQDRWMEAVLALKSSFGRTSSQEPPLAVKVVTDEVQRTTPPPPPPPAPAETSPDDEEEPGMIRSTSKPPRNSPPRAKPQHHRRGSSSVVHSNDDDELFTPPASPAVDRQIVPTSPRSIASPSDLLSVDSSLYIEGNSIAASAHSAASPAVVSPRMASPRLSPPGGGSTYSGARSVRSASSQPDAEADEFFKKPYTPGAHYLKTKPRKVSPGSSPKDSQYQSGGVRQNSPLPLSPTRHAELEVEETQSPRGATTYSNRDDQSMSPQKSRAGLFSRRGRPADRLLPPSYESEASASENEGSFARRTSITRPKSNRVPPSADDQVSVGGASATSSQKSTPTTKSKTASAWTSFLSELSKAEEQFFNPKSSGSNTKAAASSNGRESPPPPPPPSRPGDEDYTDDASTSHAEDTTDYDSSTSQEQEEEEGDRNRAKGMSARPPSQRQNRRLAV